MDKLNTSRRSLLCYCASALAAQSMGAAAQTSSTIRLVVPFTPGAANDTIGRMVAEAMAQRQARSWIVENRAGAGSQIGTDFVAKSAPDGTTLLLNATASMSILPAIKASVPYSTESDFTFLARVASSPFALVVNAKSMPQDFAGFLQLARARPSTIRLGSAGLGALDYMAASLLQVLTGTTLNVIPYRGMAQVLNDLSGGHVDAAIVSPATIAPLVKNGLVRPLVVLDDKRSSVLPDVPNAPEVGQPKLLAISWWGIAGPAKLPASVTAALERDLSAVLSDPAFRKLVADKGFDVAPLVGNAFKQFVLSDLARWKEVAKLANIVLTE